MWYQCGILMTSLWLRGEWRTSRSGCQTPAPPGKHTSPAKTSSGRGHGPQSWCRTGWAASPGRLLEPGLLIGTLWCLLLQSISKERRFQCVRSRDITNTLLSLHVVLLIEHSWLSPQKPSTHKWWQWSWQHRWETWGHRRHTQDCILGGWCRRRTVLWVSKCEEHCGKKWF